MTYITPAQMLLEIKEKVRKPHPFSDVQTVPISQIDIARMLNERGVVISQSAIARIMTMNTEPKWSTGLGILELYNELLPEEDAA